MRFHRTFPTKVIFGSGQLAQAGAEARALGKRPPLPTGKSAMQKSGSSRSWACSRAAAWILCCLKVEPNPRRESLDEAVALGISESCDFVIGLGGGSPMDGAKAVAAALAESRRQGKTLSVWDFTSGAAKRLAVEGALRCPPC